jgi:hypothetical protein
MKALKSITSLLFIALMAILLTSLFTSNPSLALAAAVVVFGVLFIASVFMPKGVAFMALQKEIWQSDIIENLYKDNAFATKAFNGDQYVLAGKVVHIPVSGTAAVIKKNLTSFPQTAVNRTDSEITYALDNYYALPRQIQNLEQYELSYDKRQSMVGDDQRNLIQSAMEGLLYRWAPAAAKVIETSGADSGLDLMDDTATGTRKLFTKDVFKTIAKKLANTNIAGTPNALLTANHYHQLFESFSDAEKTNFNSFADAKTGRVAMYMGISIMMRSSVLRYRKVGGIWTVVDTQDDAFAAGAGDSAASLFWIDSCVERAKGDVHVFDDNGNPLYYGDVFSAEMRLGGRIRRAAGVYAAVEAIGA